MYVCMYVFEKNFMLLTNDFCIQIANQIVYWLKLTKKFVSYFLLALQRGKIIHCNDIHCDIVCINFK